MKKILTLIFATFIVANVFSQSPMFQQKMKETLMLMDSAKSIQDMQEVAAQFERIGDVEKTQWLPYYYAALNHILVGWRDQKADKDKLAEKSKSIIAKAEAIEKNAELYMLSHMVATQQMMVDPQSRFMTYWPLKTELMTKAKALDPNNPRVHYLEGQDVFNTPPAFGGGKDKAKPIFQKAVDLFKAQQSANPFAPKWGQKDAEAMLAKSSS